MIMFIHFVCLCHLGLTIKLEVSLWPIEGMKRRREIRYDRQVGRKSGRWERKAAKEGGRGKERQRSKEM